MGPVDLGNVGQDVPDAEPRVEELIEALRAANEGV
jgi:hypothetical protein